MKLNKRKCKNCKEVFQKNMPLQSTCSILCAIAWAKKLEEKKTERKAIDERHRIREEKEKIKTLSELKQDLQPLVNEIARLIDNGYCCISCDGTGKMSGGHYWATGGHDQLRFNLHNIWAQDFHCNNHKGGAPREYIDSIEKIFGKKYANYLQYEIRLLTKDTRFERVSILNAIKVARIERNALKKANLKYSRDNRIIMRNKINEKLQIYSLKNFEI